MYRWVPYIPFRGVVAILLGMLHANETGIISSPNSLVLWLRCAFTLYPTLFSIDPGTIFAIDEANSIEI